MPDHKCHKEEDIKIIRVHVEKLVEVIAPIDGLGMAGKVKIMWRSLVFILGGLVLTAIKVFIK